MRFSSAAFQRGSTLMLCRTRRFATRRCDAAASIRVESQCYAVALLSIHGIHCFALALPRCAPHRCALPSRRIAVPCRSLAQLFCAMLMRFQSVLVRAFAFLALSPLSPAAALQFNANPLLILIGSLRRGAHLGLCVSNPIKSILWHRSANLSKAIAAQFVAIPLPIASVPVPSVPIHCNYKIAFSAALKAAIRSRKASNSAVSAC